MQADEWRLFLEVAELGSFTRAAARRLTVQSHISRRIAALEAKCGSALFRRTGRGVALTDFGEHVAQRVRRWLQESDELFADIRDTARVPMGVVRVGILPSAAHPLMTEVYRRLHREYPGVRLDVREGQGSELDALLDAGSVELAVLFRHERPARADETLLATAATYLVSQPGRALTAGRTVSFRQLRGVPLVLPRRPAHWRDILDETARSRGFRLEAAIEADSLRMQKELLVQHPHLYALLGPFSVDSELRSGRLQAAQVVAPDLRRYVTLAYPRQGSLTRASRIVAQLVGDTVRGWGGRLGPPADGPR